MEEAKLMKAPIHASNPLSKDESGKPVDQNIYRGMIGSLQYLTATRYDIMCSIYMCARFQSNF